MGTNQPHIIILASNASTPLLSWTDAFGLWRNLPYEEGSRNLIDFKANPRCRDIEDSSASGCSPEDFDRFCVKAGEAWSPVKRFKLFPDLE